jgi:Domain of unknown function (DUF6265)
MKTLGLTLAALALGGASGPAPSATAPDWLAGRWVEIKGQEWTEESWVPMRGGVMLSAGRSGAGDKLYGWEQNRIERGADGVLTYWAAPGGAAPTAFPMLSATKDAIIFANPSHDFPQRIHYWREGKELRARISLIDGSKAMEWRYQPMGR